MKKYVCLLSLLSLLFCFGIIPSDAHADETFSMEKVDNAEFPEIIFQTNEQHGIIDHFDVSEQGQIATSLNGYKINVYDDVQYSYSIVPKISHVSLTLQWEDETLCLYVSARKDLGYAVKILDFEEYEVYRIPETEKNKTLWENLPRYVKELDISDKHYYMSEGNLLYQENGASGSFYIADNAFFDPALLLLPVVLLICIKLWHNRKKIQNMDDA